MQMSAMKACFQIAEYSSLYQKRVTGLFSKKTPKLREISSRIKNTSKNLVVSQKLLYLQAKLK